MIAGTTGPSFFESFTIVQTGTDYGRRNVGIWCSGAFPGKVTPSIDFTDEVQCDIPVLKILLSMIRIYKCSQINSDVNT